MSQYRVPDSFWNTLLHCSWDACSNAIEWQCETCCQFWCMQCVYWSKNDGPQCWSCGAWSKQASIIYGRAVKEDGTQIQDQEEASDVVAVREVFATHEVGEGASDLGSVAGVAVEVDATVQAPMQEESKPDVDQDVNNEGAEMVDDRNDAWRAAMQAQARDAAHRDEELDIELHLFFCPSCYCFKTAPLHDADEWQICRPCRMACFHCRVEITKVHCHVCRTYFATPEELVHHLRIEHGLKGVIARASVQNL